MTLAEFNAEHKPQWRVSYRYVNPHGAGPFRGRMVLDYKPEKGEEIYAMMGRAIVQTVSKVKTA